MHTQTETGYSNNLSQEQSIKYREKRTNGPLLSNSTLKHFLKGVLLQG